jgi:hypothetical protein
MHIFQHSVLGEDVEDEQFRYHDGGNSVIHQNEQGLFGEMVNNHKYSVKSDQ